MLANLVFYGLVWCLTSGMTALILSLTVFRKTPVQGADAEFDCEAAALDGMEFYRDGEQSVIFNRSEAEVS